MKEVTEELVREVFTAWVKAEGKDVEILRVGPNASVPGCLDITYLEEEKPYLAMFWKGGLVNIHRLAYHPHPDTITRLEKEKKRLTAAFHQAVKIRLQNPRVERPKDMTHSREMKRRRTNKLVMTLGMHLRVVREAYERFPTEENAKEIERVQGLFRVQCARYRALYLDTPEKGRPWVYLPLLLSYRVRKEWKDGTVTFEKRKAVY